MFDLLVTEGASLMRAWMLATRSLCVPVEASAPAHSVIEIPGEFPPTPSKIFHNADYAGFPGSWR
jgi:hypothetical protein